MLDRKIVNMSIALGHKQDKEEKKGGYEGVMVDFDSAAQHIVIDP